MAIWKVLDSPLTKLKITPRSGSLYIYGGFIVCHCHRSVDGIFFTVSTRVHVYIELMAIHSVALHCIDINAKACPDSHKHHLIHNYFAEPRAKCFGIRFLITSRQSSTGDTATASPSVCWVTTNSLAFLWKRSDRQRHIENTPSDGLHFHLNSISTMVECHARCESAS